MAMYVRGRSPRAWWSNVNRLWEGAYCHPAHADMCRRDQNRNRTKGTTPASSRVWTAPVMHVFFVNVNRGKRTLCCDFAHRGGQDALSGAGAEATSSSIDACQASATRGFGMTSRAALYPTITTPICYGYGRRGPTRAARVRRHHPGADRDPGVPGTAGTG